MNLFRRTTALSEVQTMAEVLDRVRPGWANEVNTKTLDLENARNCVLGQVYGDYGFGLRRLDCDVNTLVFVNNRAFRKSWILEINKRVEESVKQPEKEYVLVS